MTRTPLLLAAALSGLVATGPASSEPLQRIEDFRRDLPAAAIAEARLRHVRSTSAQAYLLSVPAFLHFRQATEFKLGRRAVAPDEEPFGGWVLLRDLTDWRTRDTLPNVDTLYGASYLRLDLQGPVVLSVPEVRDRYMSVALHDAYFSAVAIVGTRTTGGRASNILIAPPGWAAAQPDGIDQVVVMPTPAVVLYQRIFVRGPDDVAAVRAIQDRIRLAPLARWQKGEAGFPPIATPEYDVPGVRDIRDPLRFFELADAATALNPPPVEYRAMTAVTNSVGVGPGAQLPQVAAERDAIMAGARDAQALIDAEASSGHLRNGWRVPDPRVGRLGLAPLTAAVTQITQIGSLPPEEALYFVATQDAAGENLSGESRYALTFAPGQLPPVEPLGFWSVTMYRAADGLLVPNAIGRFILRPDTPGLTRQPDGSLVLHIAAERPAGVPEGNWLPAPKDNFQIALRTYLPRTAIRSGDWFPPAIRREQR